MKNIDNAVECLRTHILVTEDTVSEAVEKFYAKLGFTQEDKDILAKARLHSLVSAVLVNPNKAQYSRTYDLQVRPATAAEKSLTGKSTSTMQTSPRVTTKPSKHLLSIIEQVLLNVALEGAKGRRTKLIDFTRLDCQHYTKAQSFVADGIERKSQVVSNIEIRLKHYDVYKVGELPLKEQTAIAREWRNAEKGVASSAFAVSADA